ncbi:NAD-dependent epimerase/dehydratase family protein [Peterkaempfera bronchialis]|uniref:NAD-dependent epimerase/dehydratase family protein n=1 Tax=Peterkaempfera bronchialis TaxID=2126346 RepID=A0A345T3Y3_9ACTN|nr:NAD-dependent epimerase/dehydratase family protein [Peterkaempfera bronchialis]AXI80688.1 NAD-dependent epimerase/dehydratase family protein [Peterkaempfera bronchialis]
MRVLVTGGSGFLGRAVCVQLRAAGHQVRSLGRHRSAQLAALGVEQHPADLRDRAAVADAVAGCAAVIHCAAKAGAWGPAAEYHAVNVGGTENVIAGCLEHGVRRLVYTSSPSVVHRGRDLEGVDESVPYATRFPGPYPRSKAEAEQRVLAANSPQLATVALRPHLIWGPGDPHFTPRILEAARTGRLRLVGPPGKRIDTTYVDNAAEAHLLALDRLHPAAPIAGRAYFLSQGDPRTTDDTLNALLAAAGLPPETRRVPRAPARAAAALLETAYRAARVPAEPPLTRLVAGQLGTSHWFDISAARRDLDYRPRIGTEEGLRRLAWHLAASTAGPENGGAR